MGPGSPLRFFPGLLAACLLLPLSSSTDAPTSAATSEPPSGWDEATSGAPTAGTPLHPTPSPGQASSSPGPASSPAWTSEPGPASSKPSPTDAAGVPVPSELPDPGTTPRPGPWPAPVTDVAELCVCDLLVDQCDVNCCCDPICTAADFSLFTMCSVPVVTGDRHLCRQQEALYSIDPTAHPPERIFQLSDKVNPSIFCIQSTNNKAALSFQAPEIPTMHNFDRLLQEFGDNTFGIESNLALEDELDTRQATSTNSTSKYKYNDPIQTSDGFLNLPAPLFLAWCTHGNPAGFLVNQAVKCNTMITGDACTALPGLSMQFYTSSSVLAAPESRLVVNITIQSITVQSPEGLRTRLKNTDALILPTLNGQSCSNVVLEASYLITFTEAGEIASAGVSLILGTINMMARFVLQSFEIRFIQEETQPVRLSGSPGYVVGLPIKAGFRTAGSGIVQSTNEAGQLTLMKSTAAQDCLAVEGVRTPVLFGYSMLSGCQLRITKDADCRLLAPALLSVLKGQNFPDYVASFGDSLPQNELDWLQISNNVTEASTCEIPVSFQIEVKWTKYGSLVNPQAKIVSLTATVMTAALPQVDSGSEQTIQIFSSATFVDVSAPAEPGYKARPPIEANLPFDFFFPFV
ncbi:tectonic-1 isoform X1 [Podarcis muralis]